MYIDTMNINLKIVDSADSQTRPFSHRVHYRGTSFVRYKKGSKRDSLFSDLQEHILSWFAENEAPQSTEEWIQIKETLKKNEHHSISGEGPHHPYHLETMFSPLDTNGEKHSIWAMRYEHDDTELKHQRKWRVNIGLKACDEETCSICTSVEYLDFEQFLGTNNTPLPSTPRFIKRLIGSATKYNLAFDRDFHVLQQAKPISICTEEQLDTACTIISAVNRKFPIIVVNGATAAIVKAANIAAKEMSAKAAVLCVGKISNSSTLSTFLKSSQAVKWGQMRVFYPHGLTKGDMNLNRYCYIFDSDFSVEYDSIKKNILPLLITSDKDESFMTGNEIMNHIVRRKLEDLAKTLQKRRKVAQSDKTHLHSLKNKVADLEKELKETNAFLEMCLKDNAQLTQKGNENDSLKAENQRLKLQLDSQRTETIEIKQQNKNLTSLFKHVQENLSNEQYLSLFKILNSDKFIILDDAIESAKECSSSPEKCRMILEKLRDVMYPMKFESGKVFDCKEFTDRTNLKLKMTESKMTKNDSKLMQSRTVTYNGETYDISMHIALGNDKNNCLRVHLCFVEDERKILIGHFGKHLTTFSTPKCTK